MSDIYTSVKELCASAKSASAILTKTTGAERNTALLLMKAALLDAMPEILAANATDMEHAAANGVSVPMQDRLRLNESRVTAIADALGKLSTLPDPIGSGEVFSRPNGLSIRRVSVPLGVVGMIYEARPNVTADAAGLCVKSGNAAVLRGGKEAIHTNIAMVAALRRGLEAALLPADCICLITETDRESASALMKMRGYIDVLIPRGGKGLIKSVTENASVPVIETGAGNCHLYVDAGADLDMALTLTVNAKTQRPSVCNAIETLLVHKDEAKTFLPMLEKKLDAFHTHVELRGCAQTRVILPAVTPATEEDWETEYDDYILAVKIVSDVDEAIAHINRYNTHHSETIVTRDIARAARFQCEIDAACVYVNASTRFTDGEEFGFGAEIGISTQKLHARGPMGLSALTTVKYLINGNGQIRT